MSKFAVSTHLPPWKHYTQERFTVFRTAQEDYQTACPQVQQLHSIKMECSVWSSFSVAVYHSSLSSLPSSLTGTIVNITYTLNGNVLVYNFYVSQMPYIVAKFALFSLFKVKSCCQKYECKADIEISRVDFLCLYYKGNLSSRVGKGYIRKVMPKFVLAFGEASSPEKDFQQPFK